MSLLNIRNMIAYCFSQERSYKPTSAVDQMAVHFVLEGSLLHEDSDEARRLRAKEGLPEGSYWNMLQYSSMFTDHSNTFFFYIQGL